MDHLSVGLSRGGGQRVRQTTFTPTQQGGVVGRLAWSWIFRLTWPGSFCSEMTLKLTRGALRSGVGGYGGGSGGRDRVTRVRVGCVHTSPGCVYLLWRRSDVVLASVMPHQMTPY